MIKNSSIHKILGVCITFIQVSNAYAIEYLLESDINARVEYNDNIFLTNLPHDSVKGVIITPTIYAVIKEQHWESKLSARIRSHNYSDDTLDTNDQFFDLAGRYIGQRNIFSLNYNYDFDSNLNSTSSDFGIGGRRVNREIQSLTPQYTRLLTERSVLSLSYTYSDVDYLEAENTGYTPYIAESGLASLVYDLTERDKVTLGLTAVDYASQDDSVTYQLYKSRFGINHEFSQRLSADFSIGISRRSTTSLRTEAYDVLGSIILVPQEIDSKSRGLVYDAGFSQLFEAGQVTARISRDNNTNSFGGLDEVNKLKIAYTDKLSELWRYAISARIEDITSISTSARTTDRDVLFFESIIYYSITEKWNANASYRYIQRKYKSDTSDDRAPHSNRVYIGLTYNFPTLSTF